jgi:hypothetical protein
MCGGGLAGAAALFAGRKLTATGTELPKKIPASGIQSKVAHPKFNAQGVQSGRILRIAHPVSSWVRDGKVKSGHWFTHKWCETDCLDIGTVLWLSKIEFVGAKAMRFDSESKQGVGPVECYTDPDSKGYKDIVDQANQRYPFCVGLMWGPVYKLTTSKKASAWPCGQIEGQELELFCGTKSLRRFAYDSLGSETREGEIKLEVAQAKNSKMDYTWYVPRIGRPSFYTSRARV